MIMQNMNYMNQGIMPGDQPLNNEWLRAMGIIAPSFDIPSAAQQFGQPGQPMSGMPGGQGWDGALAKLGWMAQQAKANRQVNRPPHVPAGHPGMGPADIEAQSTGKLINGGPGSIGGVKGAGTGGGGKDGGPLGGLGSLFGQLGGFLMQNPKMIAPIPYGVSRIFK